MARNNAASINYDDILDYLQMASREPSLTSPNSTDPQIFTPAQTPQTANTTPGSLHGLSMSGLTNFNSAYSPLDMPLPANPPSASTPSSADSLSPGYFNAFREQRNLPQFGTITRAPGSFSVNALAPQQMPSQQQFIVQQTPQAQRARQTQTASAFRSPPLLDNENLRVSINRDMRTPAALNMAIQQYHNTLSAPGYDQPLSKPICPTTRAMTPQSALFPGSNARQNQPLGQIGTAFVDSQQGFAWQANVEVERQRQLNQQWMLMARRQQPQIPQQQQQQSVVKQNANSPPVVPQFDLRPPQCQPNRRDDWQIHHRESRTPRSLYGQPNPQMQLPSTGIGIGTSNSMQNAQLPMKRAAESPQVYSSSKRPRIGDSDTFQVQSTLRSSYLQQRVPVTSTGSNLRVASQQVNMGRQYPQKVPHTPVQSGFAASTQKQQGKPHVAPVQNMSGHRRDSGPVPTEPATQRRKGVGVQNEPQGFADKRSSYSRTVLTSTTQEPRAETHIITPTKQQPHETISLVSTPSDLIKVEASTPIQTPITPRTDAPNNLISPPKYPQQGKSEPTVLSDDEFASILQKFVDKANASEKKQQENPGSFKASQELLLIGPLTKEQNSKALVQGIKVDMKRRGPSVGTNPDLDTAAAPRFLLNQRRKWSDQFKREEVYISGGVTYIPAYKVMESAAGNVRRS